MTFKNQGRIVLTPLQPKIKDKDQTRLKNTVSHTSLSSHAHTRTHTLTNTYTHSYTHTPPETVTSIPQVYDFCSVSFRETPIHPLSVP